MQIVPVVVRTSECIDQLVALWEDSVLATHQFLTRAEIAQIKQYVPTALREVPQLFVAQDDAGKALGFMGIAGANLEMLFLAPSARGQGVGRALITVGIEQCGVTTLTVNEQNPQALGFYQHMGFRRVGRSDVDDQGQPYPVIYMRR